MRNTAEDERLTRIVGGEQRARVLGHDEALLVYKQRPMLRLVFATIVDEARDSMKKRVSRRRRRAAERVDFGLV